MAVKLSYDSYFKISKAGVNKIGPQRNCFRMTDEIFLDMTFQELTHWSLMIHLCIMNLVFTGMGDDLSHVQTQAIT